MKYRRPLQRGVPAKFGGAPSITQNIGVYINDYAITPILHVRLPQHEASLVLLEIWVGSCILCPHFRRPWLNVKYFR